ncbi:MAG: tungstate ABC transporter ATP-binding protein WtpC [Bacillota bacterium]
MIKLENINCNLGDFQIRDVDLKIKEEEYFIILGPTGTGKSILLELIAGLQVPEQGDIWFGEQRITDLPPEKRKIAMVYQDYMLFPHLNVRENIIFGLKVRKIKVDREELEQIVSLLGISHLLARSVETLSGGEKQRVALARALITAPRILLLDEPLSALDPNTTERLQQDLKKIHAELGTTTLHVTHDFDEALALADRVGIMNQGELVQVGVTEDVFKQPKTDFVANFVGAKNIFQGLIIEEEQDKFVQLKDDLNLAVVTEQQGEVSIVIRPEDIIMSNQALNSSARNTYQGQIIAIQKRLSLVEVRINIGIELSVYITHHSLKELEIKVGKELYIAFKASAIHVY